MSEVIFKEIFSDEMIRSAIRMAVPLFLAALGGTFSERGGVVNIGLEGMMLMGGFAAAAASLYLTSPVASFVLALATAFLISYFALFVALPEDKFGGTALRFVMAGAVALMGYPLLRMGIAGLIVGAALGVGIFLALFWRFARGAIPTLVVVGALSGAFSWLSFLWMGIPATRGILVGVWAGMALALIHAVACITFRSDQIISGTAINILSAGLTVFLSYLVFHTSGGSPSLPYCKLWAIPGLSKIPYLRIIGGPYSPVVFITFFLLLPLSHWLLFKTVFGLRLRSVGENPWAADSLGINVYLMKYIGVLISGALAGLAGAYLSVEHSHVFVKGMSAGRGFIGLAAMIFGNWTPLGAAGASLIFGFADALQMRLQGFGIPTQFIQMIPYVLTIVVLAGVVGKATPPAADGVRYAKEEE